jgi:hypothetical protein
MWIMTDQGFISAVYKAGKLQVRARDRVSLERIFPDHEIITNVGTDYPFRVYTTHDELAEIISASIKGIQYSNFKTQAKATRGANYEGVLHSIWTTLLRLEPADARKFIGKGSWRLPAPAAKGKKGRKQRGQRAFYQDIWDRFDAEDRDTPAPTQLFNDVKSIAEADAWEDDEWTLALMDKRLSDLTDDEYAYLERQGVI